MSSSTPKSGYALAAAAAALFASGAYAAGNDHDHGDHGEQEAKVQCLGVNACKGTSVCATAHNACTGQNACKGQGLSMMTPSKCEDAGGTVKKS